MKLLVTLAAIAAACAAVSPAAAGTLVVGGDTTPTFSLSGPGADAGNRRFYDNLRHGTSRIVVSQRSFAPAGFPSFANGNLIDFYRETPGVAVVETKDEVTRDILAGAGLLVLQFPNDAFAGTEMAAIGDFVRAGGSVLVVGEASVVSTTFPAPSFTEGSQANSSINGLLAGIGSNIRIDDDTIGCCGSFTATGAAIGTDPLTAGVTSFTYGAATSLSGGTALFFAPGDGGVLLPFFATEDLLPSALVPEPATWAMMIAGFALVGGAARRRTRPLLA